jgi:hypothetical protein
MAEWLIPKEVRFVRMLYKAIDKLVDKLPGWAKPIFWLVVGILGVIGSVYIIAHDGFFVFLLKLIFSP